MLVPPRSLLSVLCVLFTFIGVLRLVVVVSLAFPSSMVFFVASFLVYCVCDTYQAAARGVPVVDSPRDVS